MLPQTQKEDQRKAKWGSVDVQIRLQRSLWLMPRCILGVFKFNTLYSRHLGDLYYIGALIWQLHWDSYATVASSTDFFWLFFTGFPPFFYIYLLLSSSLVNYSSASGDLSYEWLLNSSSLQEGKLRTLTLHARCPQQWTDINRYLEVIN